MSMNREGYELANRIEPEFCAEGNCLSESLSDVEMKRYKNTVLDEIKKEKQMKKNTFHKTTVAACAALILIAGTVFLGDEVHAMVRQISWSISNALGISSDLADYREVVNTSVADKGYVITLQEAVVTEKKLLVSYTIRREDGQKIDDEKILPAGSLYINGKKIHRHAAVSSSSRFVDEEETILGVVAEYHILDMDFSQENEYEIEIDCIDFEGKVKGKWDFAFRANGTDLIADTVRTVINKEFELPDGVVVRLKEFTTNDLEQRITYELSAPSYYTLELKAVDSEGMQTRFHTRVQEKYSGYMQNGGSFGDDELESDRLNAENQTVTMTFYAMELAKESGRTGNDYVQIGESFEVTF